MTPLALSVFDVLALVLGLPGLGLFLLAAGALLIASFRVGVLGRPLVLPFSGSDARRVEGAALTSWLLLGERELRLVVQVSRKEGDA